MDPAGKLMGLIDEIKTWIRVRDCDIINIAVAKKDLEIANHVKTFFDQDYPEIKVGVHVVPDVLVGPDQFIISGRNSKLDYDPAVVYAPIFHKREKK